MAINRGCALRMSVVLSSLLRIVSADASSNFDFLTTAENVSMAQLARAAAGSPNATDMTIMTNALLTSSYACHTCEHMAGGLVLGGSLVGCAVRCNRYPFGEGKVLCNLLCNALINGGCSKYGANCAHGVCRVLGKCHWRRLAIANGENHTTNGTVMETTMPMQAEVAPLATVAEAAVTSSNATDFALMTNALLDTSYQCHTCVHMVEGMLVGGVFVGCAVKCAPYPFGGGKVLCNLICNALIHGGCSKYGANCKIGVCRALNKCPWGRRLAGAQAGDMLI